MQSHVFLGTRCSVLTTEFLKRLGVSLCFVALHHAEANGLVERFSSSLQFTVYSLFLFAALETEMRVPKTTLSFIPKICQCVSIPSVMTSVSPASIGDQAIARVDRQQVGRRDRITTPYATKTNKKAVLPQGNRAMPQVFFSDEVRQQHSLQVQDQPSFESHASDLQTCWRKKTT